MKTPDLLLERAVRLLLERRGTFLFVVAALTVALGFAASRLEFTTSPETILRSTYGEFANLRSHEKVFGGFEHRLVLVVTAEDVFHPEVRDRIHRATERIGSLPSVSRVRSLARPGFPLPAAAVGPAGFRKAVAENRLLTPFLVSRDGTTTALLVDLHPDADTAKTREASMDAALDAARAEGLDPMVTGIPAVRGAYATYIAEDLFVLPPLVGLLLAALTSAILCAGFLAFLVSGFKATEQFGLIAAVTIAAALIGDLMVLPALLLRVPTGGGREPGGTSLRGRRSNRRSGPPSSRSSRSRRRRRR